MLRRRVGEQKVNVRKAALQALHCIIELNRDDVGQQVRDGHRRGSSSPSARISKAGIGELFEPRAIK